MLLARLGSSWPLEGGMCTASQRRLHLRSRCPGVDRVNLRRTYSTWSEGHTVSATLINNVTLCSKADHWGFCTCTP